MLVANMKVIAPYIFLVIALAASGAVLPAQTPAATHASASVEGNVLCNDGNFPARGATVSLVSLTSLLPPTDGAKGEPLDSPKGETDFNGYYLIPHVRPGVYIIDARKDGYNNDLDLVRMVLKRFSPDDQKKLLATFPQVTVAGDGTMREDLVLRRGGAISGRVTVDSGGTLKPIPVTATLVSSSLTGDTAGSGDQQEPAYARNAMTDDRGVYRIAGLPQGKYLLQIRTTESFYVVVPSGGMPVAIPTRAGTGELTLFAPEALTKTDAKLVSIGDGDELQGVDIVLPMRKLHSIGGTVTQGGVAVSRSWLNVLRDGKKAMNYSAMTTPDGSYRFDLLPSGAYTVEAYSPGSEDSDVHAIRKTITVQLGDDDVLDANLDLPTQAPK
jgi:hypothetical protein